MRAKPIFETHTETEREIHELTLLSPVSWCPVCACGETADDPHRRLHDSELDDASFDHADIADETENQLEAESRSCGEPQQMIGRKDITEHKVRVFFDKLETWRFCVQFQESK